MAADRPFSCVIVLRCGDQVLVELVWMSAAFPRSWCTRRPCWARPCRTHAHSAGSLKRQVRARHRSGGAPRVASPAVVNQASRASFHWLSFLSVRSETQLGDDEDSGEQLHLLIKLGLQGGIEGQAGQLCQCLCRVHWTAQDKGTWVLLEEPCVCVCTDL